jgi:hemolysin III
MITLYGASALYHALRLTEAQLKFFKLLDHSAIYGLIAGTYTPGLIVLLRERTRKHVLLIGVWALAAVGVACKWFVPTLPYWLTVGLYFGMGWLAIVPGLEMIRAVGLRGMKPVLYGGLAYTAGGIVDLADWPILLPHVIGPHEVFHVLVMLGTWFHVVFMIQFVAPYPRAMPSRQTPLRMTEWVGRDSPQVPG